MSHFNNVKIVSYCPICGANFNIKYAKIIEERPDAQIIHINCSKCHTAVLAFLQINPSGVNSVGLISDLSSQEVTKYKTQEKITCDEVIDFCTNLQKDNKGLLKREFQKSN